MEIKDETAAVILSTSNTQLLYYNVTYNIHIEQYALVEFVYMYIFLLENILIRIFRIT